jgi:hypothetical protein
VDPNLIPIPHRDPWVNLLGTYVTETAGALAAHGLSVQRTWLDPHNPRDATIRYARPAAIGAPASDWALVWDEETGWRQGHFVAGAPGHRTVLTQLTYLGGGLLPQPDEVAHRIVSGQTAALRKYRSYTDVRDGLDDGLRIRPAPLANSW